MPEETTTSMAENMVAAGGDGLFTNPLGSASFEILLAQILGVVVAIGVPLLGLAIVYVGFLFVTARGNEQQIESAKRAFFWTVIGGFVLIGAAAIAEVIKETIGVL